MSKKRARWINSEDVIEHDALMQEVDEGMLKTNRKKPSVQMCGLPSKEMELQILGQSDGNAQCFGCCYIGEHDTAVGSYEDIMSLINMVRQSIARVNPIYLAKYVAKKYKHIQDQVNDSLQPGDEPWPDWTAATILDHFRNHNTDPEMQSWMTLSELQEMKRIASDAAVVYDPDTGQKSLDEKQTKLFLELVKTIETYSKSDPSKKLFYSDGKHLDVKSASDGVISTSGKRLVRYLEGKKRKL